MPQNSHKITKEQAENNRIWHRKDFYKNVIKNKTKPKK